MKTLVILASVLLVFAAIGVAFAASDNASVTASVTVPGTISITADNLVFADTEVGDVTADLSVTVDANADYTVSTKADAATFAGPTPFAISNLKFGVTSYTTSDQTLVSGTAPGTTHTVGHTLTVPADTEAGDYSVGITLTATA